jgi:predicted PurR-regulated permease PerM
MILSVIVAISVFVGLWLLDVDYALLLALLAGLFEIIPFVGPVFSGGVAVLISISNSFAVALYTLALFVVIQQVENHILVPSVMRFTANLNPALVIIALMLGGAVFGFAGLILAVPATVLLQEVASDWEDKKHRRRGLGL